MAVCSKCGNWHVRPDDVFCANCRACLLSFICVPGTDMIPVEVQGKPIAIDTRVRNIGSASLTAQVEAFPSDTAVTFNGLPVQVRLAPGEEGALPFTATFAEIRKACDQGRELRISVGEGIAEVPKIAFYRPAAPPAISFYRPGPPSLSFIFHRSPDALQKDPGFLATEQGRPATVVLEARNTGGTAVRITFTGLDAQPAWARIEPREDVAYPLRSAYFVYSLESKDPALIPLQTVFAATLTPLDGGAVTEEQIEMPPIALLQPPTPNIIRVVRRPGAETKHVPVSTVVDLGDVMQSERRRERFFLRNEGDQDTIHLPMRGLYTPFPDNDSSFLASFDRDTQYVPAGGQGRAFHVVVEGKGHAEAKTHTVPLLLDLSPYAERKIGIRFHIPRRVEYTGVVGIDFGTSNSCVAHINEVGQPPQLARIEGGCSAYIPSVLYFHGPEDYIVGEEALDWFKGNPANGVSCLKRGLMGDKRVIHGKEFKPDELVGLFVRELVSVATRDLQRTPLRLVLTVPVDFTPSQRRIIRESARGAVPDLQSVQTVEEPVAAALHYVWSHPEEFSTVSAASPKRIAVYDFGGGTLDVAIIEVGGDPPMRVLMRRGDGRLGGVDLDRLIASDLAARIAETPAFSAFDRDIIELKRARFYSTQRVRENPTFRDARTKFATTVQEAKEQLSEHEKVEFDIPSEWLLTAEGKALASAGHGYGWRLQRDELEQIIHKRVHRSIQVLQTAIEAADLEPSDIDILLLTGQVSRTPVIRRRLRDLFPSSKTCIPDMDDGRFDPKACVALGAAEIGIRQFSSVTSIGCIGRIGYFDSSRSIYTEFRTVLSDSFPFGAFGEEPAEVRIDEDGKGHLDIYRNQRPDNAGTSRDHGSAGSEKLASLEITSRTRASSVVRVYLGLDEYGELQARLEEREGGDEIEVKPAHRDEEEEW